MADPRFESCLFLADSGFQIVSLVDFPVVGEIPQVCSSIDGGCVETALSPVGLALGLQSADEAHASV